MVNFTFGDAFNRAYSDAANRRQQDEQFAEAQALQESLAKTRMMHAERLAEQARQQQQAQFDATQAADQRRFMQTTVPLNPSLREGGDRAGKLGGLVNGFNDQFGARVAPGFHQQQAAQALQMEATMEALDNVRADRARQDEVFATPNLLRGLLGDDTSEREMARLSSVIPAYAQQQMAANDPIRALQAKQLGLEISALEQAGQVQQQAMGLLGRYQELPSSSELVLADETDWEGGEGWLSSRVDLARKSVSGLPGVDLPEEKKIRTNNAAQFNQHLTHQLRFVQNLNASNPGVRAQMVQAMGPVVQFEIQRAINQLETAPLPKEKREELRRSYNLLYRNWHPMGYTFDEHLAMVNEQKAQNEEK